MKLGKIPEIGVYDEDEGEATDARVQELTNNILGKPQFIKI